MEPPHTLFWWMSPRKDNQEQWWWGYRKVFMRRLPESEKQAYIEKMRSFKL